MNKGRYPRLYIFLTINKNSRLENGISITPYIQAERRMCGDAVGRYVFS